MKQSNKRRTTSNSGNSAKSTTKGTSHQAKSSSATSPASFEQIFGNPTQEAPERTKAKDQLLAARIRLSTLVGTPMPSSALLRTRQVARIGRTRKYVRDLEEYLKETDKVSR